MSIDRDWALVGTVLRDIDALADVRDILEPDDLSAGASLAFEAICALDDSGGVASITGIGRWVEAAEHWDPRLDAMGGSQALQARCLAAASQPRPENVRGLAGEIKVEALQRRLAQYLAIAYRRATQPVADLASFVSEIEATIADLKPVGTGHPMTSLEAARRCVVRHEDETGPLTVNTGLDDLDCLIGGGFEAGRLYVIGARPGMGKTALALDIARRVAHREHPVLVSTLEMHPDECYARVIASEAQINSRCITKGTTPNHQLSKLTTALGRVQTLPLAIADAAGQSIFGVSSLIRRAHRTGTQLAIVDYLGLLSTAKGQPKEQWQLKGDNCRHLKVLAGRLGIPIILLVQVAQRADGKRPTLADYYGSGAIAMHADVCMTLYRPDLYDENEAPGVCEVHVVKNRAGAMGRVNLRYTPEHNRYDNLARLEVVGR